MHLAYATEPGYPTSKFLGRTLSLTMEGLLASIQTDCEEPPSHLVGALAARTARKEAAMRIGGDWSNDESLAWRRKGPFTDQFQLMLGSHVLATLTIGGLAIITAQVQTLQHQYGFRTDGIGIQRIRIWDASDGEETADFDREVIGILDLRRSGRAGTLRIARIGWLEWHQSGWWWRPTYVFTDRFSNPLMRLCPAGGVLECVLGGMPDPLDDSWQGLILLTALGWFVLVVTGRARPPRLTLAA